MFYVGPVAVTLGMIWSWLDYSKRVQGPTLQLLEQFEGLLDDFGRLNFEQSGEAEDHRIVKLLELISPGVDVSNPVDGAVPAPRVKELFYIFQHWFFSMRDKVKIMMRRAGSLLDHDLVELANDFVEFYNGYLEKIADGTLNFVNRRELVNSQKARELFKNFATTIAELRGRANIFLRKLRSHGYPISGTEVKALETDPWAESSSGDSENQTGTRRT